MKSKVEDKKNQNMKIIWDIMMVHSSDIGGISTDPILIPAGSKFKIRTDASSWPRTLVLLSNDNISMLILAVVKQPGDFLSHSFENPFY
jgi:hypothetical protein